MFSQYASERHGKGKPLRLNFVDIRKAYFNGRPTRNLSMHFPKELGLPSNVVARLVRCAYGCRDAGHIWEVCYRSALESIGFVTGAASPSCFYQKTRDISVVVHGDDFTALGTDADLDFYETRLAEHFELKIRGRIGEGVQQNPYFYPVCGAHSRRSDIRGRPSSCRPLDRCPQSSKVEWCIDSMDKTAKSR